MKILLIVQPDRFDFYNYLSAADDVEWILLWHEKRGQMDIPEEKLPLHFSKIIYWSEYITPRTLLNKVKPDRIVFFEIIDLRQIALIVASSARKVPTFYLEHGAAGDKETAISRWKEITFKKQKLPYFAQRFKYSFGSVILSKFFYYSGFSGFASLSTYLKYFVLPFKMLGAAPNKVLAHNLFRERVPKISIVFNEVNFDEYALYTGISREEALFTGVPFFDKYFRNVTIVKDYMVYIDHPYLEENLLGWTSEHHAYISQTLFEFASKKKILLYIKLHPRSNINLWESYEYDKEFIRIVKTGDFTELYLESNLILGFSSSLITGFLCAKKNVVLLGWHPEPEIFGADFSQLGLCHESFSPADLTTHFDYWLNHNLTLENDAAYEKFLHQFNYPFDGHATERVINAIAGG